MLFSVALLASRGLRYVYKYNVLFVVVRVSTAVCLP